MHRRSIARRCATNPHRFCCANGRERRPIPLRSLIKREIDRVNADLARVEQIKDFRILPKALDPEEEGEPVTPTRKVKRQLMYWRFKTLVEDMYDDREQHLIADQAGAVQTA
jgi:hypothetical protein